MRLHLWLSPATSTSRPYSYTYNQHQAPRLSSSPSWSSRRVVTKKPYWQLSLQLSTASTFNSQKWLHWRDTATAVLHQCTSFEYDSRNKTWRLNLSTCPRHLFSCLSVKSLLHHQQMFAGSIHLLKSCNRVHKPHYNFMNQEGFLKWRSWNFLMFFFFFLSLLIFRLYRLELKVFQSSNLLIYTFLCL